MRKLIVLAMMSLDGVIQAPGRPEEDTSENFQYGGWVAPFGDEVFAEVIKKLMEPADLLLGRKTFEIWEDYWPRHEKGWPGINDVTKYVLSNTRKQSEWKNCVFLNHAAAIEDLKNSTGSDIKVWGSSKVVQQLLKNNLADDLWIITYPLILGNGKKLFDNAAMPATFTLEEHVVTSKGVIVAHYKQSGKVKTGTIEA